MNINKKLYNDIKQYCEFNNIDDIDEEINKYIKIGFNIVKYGTAPFKEYKENDLNKEELKLNIEENKSSISTIEDKPKKKIRIVKNKN